ncbi:MAG: hypothetical protein M1839_005931 [Geoglossum umbratile]|nr:MAG: hypothetical protein M1839_005931 [Geoglossum umbratile]
MLFMDPKVAKKVLLVLTRPALPLPQDVNPTKVLISKLSAMEVEEIKVLHNDQIDRKQEYKKQKALIENLHSLVHKTVSRSYYTYLIKKDTVGNTGEWGQWSSAVAGVRM